MGYFYFKSDSYNSQSNKKKFITYVCIVLIIQSGLRNLAVGSDTYGYSLAFDRVANTSWMEIFQGFKYVYIEGEGKDAGYPLLVKIFQIFFPNFRLFLIVVAMFFFYHWGRLLQKFTHNIDEVLLASALYLFLFYSFFSITGIRQTISVAMSVWAFMLLRDKRYFIFIVIFLIAFTIHKSSIIMVFFPFLYSWKKTKILIVLSILGFIICSIFRNGLISWSRSIGEYDYFEAKVPIALMLFYTVMSIFVFTSSLIFKNGNDGLKNVFNLYVPTFIWIPLLGNDSMFMREVLFFSIYCTVIIPNVLFTNHRKLLFWMLTIFAFCYYCYLQGEYKFCWQSMKLGANYMFNIEV